MGMKVYYFSYAYSRDPKAMTKRVKEFVNQILEFRDDIVPIVPHCAFDYLLNFPKGYRFGCVTNWEFEIIKRCDALVYDPEVFSVGVRWERAIAEGLGKPIFTYEEVLAGRDLRTSST